MHDYSQDSKKGTVLDSVAEFVGQEDKKQLAQIIFATSLFTELMELWLFKHFSAKIKP